MDLDYGGLEWKTLPNFPSGKNSNNSSSIYVHGVYYFLSNWKLLWILFGKVGEEMSIIIEEQQV